MNNLPFGFDSSLPGFPKFPTVGSKKDPFELVAGPLLGQELRVVSFHGEERVNDTFAYDVTFVTEVPAVLLYPAVDGEPACLTIKAPGHEPRIIQGIVAAFEPLGHIGTQYDTKMLAYNITIVPKLWLLRNQRRNRAFQNRTPRQIVEEVLAASGIRSADCRWRIRDTDYRPLPFVLQRDESDYDFFCRVLAEAGIFFYFEHANGTLDSMLDGAGGLASALSAAAKQVGGAVGNAVGQVGKAAKLVTILNFGDEAGHIPAVAPMAVVNQAIGEALQDVAAAAKFPGREFFDPEPCDTIKVDDGHGAHTDDERIHRFGLRKQIRPKSARFIEWDVKASSPWQSAAETKVVDLKAQPKIGISMGPDGPKLRGNAVLGFDVDSINLKRAQLCEDFYQLDTQFRAYPDPKLRAKRELERLRRDYLVGRGQSDCRRLGAAYRFRLGGHPVEGLNIEYTVTEVVSDGVHPDFADEVHAVYRNTFECVPSTVAPRPARPEKRPKLGLEIATVVDMGGEAVTPTLNTDECAYVHVQFKWDQYDDVRIRDGMHFERRQDPDSHTVIKVPVLQAWAGNGYGCQFIPREGMDVLIGFLGGQGERPVVLGCLYSERNLHPSQDENKHQRVGIVTKSRPTDGNWSEITIDDNQGYELVKVRAARDLEEEVLHDRRQRVGNDRSAVVHGNDSLSIEKDLAVSVGGQATEVVGKDKSVNVLGSLVESIGGDSTSQLKGAAQLAIDKSRKTYIAGDDVTTIGGRESIVVGSKQEHAESNKWVLGTYRLTAKDIVIDGEQSLVLRCQGNELRITPEMLRLYGKALHALSKDLELTSTDGPTLHLDRNAQLTAKEVTIQGASSQLKLGENAQLKGTKVQIGNGAAASTSQRDERVPEDTMSIRVLQLTDDSPLANATVAIMCPDGTRIERTTDGDGWVSVKGQPGDLFSVVAILHPTENREVAFGAGDR